MKTVEETRRELFEAWAVREQESIKRHQDGYFDYHTHGAWIGFNAALDAVEIELPSPISGHNTDANGFVNPVAVEYDECIDECRAAIESTSLGIKVK